MTFLERSSQISVLVSKVAKTSDPSGSERSVETSCQLPVQNPVQRWVRFEMLHRDLETLVQDLSLPFKGSVAEALPGFKRNRQGREDRPAIDDYLSADALELIHQQCDWSFDTFNYQRRRVSSFF